MNVQAVRVFDMNGWIQHFINDLERERDDLCPPATINKGHISLKIT